MTHFKGEDSVLFSINSNWEKDCDAADLVNSVNSSNRRVCIIKIWPGKSVILITVRTLGANL